MTLRCFITAQVYYIQYSQVIVRDFWDTLKARVNMRIFGRVFRALFILQMSLDFPLQLPVKQAQMRTPRESPPPPGAHVSSRTLLKSNSSVIGEKCLMP